MITRTNHNSRLWLLCLILTMTACAAQPRGRTTPPPADPIAAAPAAQLRGQGLAYARRGDFVRAQQYLAAAKLKGYESRIIVPELVKVCVAGSRLRAALLYGEPYLQRHPEDAGMSYVVGTIHLALGDIHRATVHLNGALRAEDLMIDAAFSLALVASKEGRVKEQARFLRQYLSVKPAGRYSTQAKVMLAKLSVLDHQESGRVGEIVTVPNALQERADDL